MIRKLKLVSQKIEITVGKKGESAGNQHGILFPQCVQKSFLLRILTMGLFSVKVFISSVKVHNYSSRADCHSHALTVSLFGIFRVQRIHSSARPYWEKLGWGKWIILLRLTGGQEQ